MESRLTGTPSAVLPKKSGGINSDQVAKGDWTDSETRSQEMHEVMKQICL